MGYWKSSSCNKCSWRLEWHSEWLLAFWLKYSSGPASKRRYFTCSLLTSIRSPWALISIFMILHHKKNKKKKNLYVPQLSCQLLEERIWFLLNTALWNERKHCLNEAVAFCHLCLYDCEINYMNSFESYWLWQIEWPSLQHNLERLM